MKVSWVSRKKALKKRISNAGFLKMSLPDSAQSERQSLTDAKRGKEVDDSI
jgi:hypothetical protein